MGEKNKFSSPGAYAGNRRGRKVAGIVGGICGTGAGLIVLIALLMHPTSFVTVINNDVKAEDAVALRLKNSVTGPGHEGTTVIDDDPQIIVEKSIDAAWPTTAKDILGYYEGLKASDRLNGAQVYEKSEEGLKDQFGMLYSIYLDNTGDKTLNYQFSLRLSDYNPPSNDASSIYSYLRVAICTAPVADPASESHHWYAATSSTKNSDGNSKEAISSWTADAAGVRTATYADPLGDIAYAEPFADSTNQGELALLTNLTINAKSTTRFTVIVYLEGNDPDCKGQPPQGESFAMTAEFSLI